MNKRSAILMALVLTGSLVAGGIALASGIGGPATSEASTATAGRADPVVRTQTRTVTIHRRAGEGAVVLGGGSPATGSAIETDDDHEGPGDDEGSVDDSSGSGSENSGPGSDHSGSEDSGHGGDDD